LIVANEFGDTPSRWDFSDDKRAEYEDDHNERDWPPESALTLYCTADHLPRPHFHPMNKLALKLKGGLDQSQAHLLLSPMRKRLRK
jgi:hypothetical protein